MAPLRGVLNPALRNQLLSSSEPKSVPWRIGPGASQTGSNIDAGMAIMNIKSTARRAGRKDSVEASEGGHAPPVGVREVQRRY